MMRYNCLFSVSLCASIYDCCHCNLGACELGSHAIQCRFGHDYFTFGVCIVFGCLCVFILFVVFFPLVLKTGIIASISHTYLYSNGEHIR